MSEENLKINVKGSSGNLYEVSFIRFQNFLRVNCTCAAGLKKLHCKHRQSLFDGDFSLIDTNDCSDIISKINSMISGSDVEVVILELKLAEKFFNEAKIKLNTVKKSFQRVVNK